MATILTPGDTVKNYRIIKQINTGAMAISYAATAPGYDKVFFKQYKSPSVRVPWYHKYVDYQREINTRIQTGLIKNMIVNSIDMFEARAGAMTYFQVFEFIEGGENLDEFLNEHRKRPSGASFDKRLIFAKVIMSSINALHKAGIVHCDLKPENLILFRDPEIKAGYRLKLIDIDFAILSFKRAPWHGSEGYVGTAGYLSPEHLTGKVPTDASDIFTCGLILYELLADGGHPYAKDEDKYAKSVLSYRAGKPTFRTAGPGEIDLNLLSETLYKALAPEARYRPSAQEILDVLNGAVAGRPEAKVERPVPIVKPEIPERRIPDKGLGSSKKIELRGPTGVSLGISIKTSIGKYLCQKMGSDAQYLDETQFVIDKNSSGEWIMVPNPSAANETLLNGKAIKGPTPLKGGDTIGVGRESKGIVKLPLKVVFIKED
jgi:serine/threonine protein kinase